jgi:opacity protein-like surface antigen
MKRFILAALLAALSAAPASARQSASDDDYSKAEGYVGYSHFRATGGGTVGFNGFEAAVTANVSRIGGLKFDLSGHYRSEFGERVSVCNYVGGVQFKNNSRAARLKPFAHLLAGGARIGGGGFSSNGFSAVVGAGLDIRAGRRVDVRVIQADYNLLRFGGDSSHNFRLGAGLVFH